MKRILLLFLSLFLSFAFIFPCFTVIAEEDTVNNGLKHPYEIQTGLIGYASLSTFIDSESDLAALISEKTPAMAFLRIKVIGGDLFVVDDNSDAIKTLKAALNDNLGDKIIPAFYVSDDATANELAKFVDKYEIEDAFVASQNPDLIKTVIFTEKLDGGKSRRTIAGILEISDTTLSFRQMSQRANGCGARGILISIQSYSYDDLKFMYSDPKISSATFYIKADTEFDIYKSISYGVEALCTKNWQKAISIFEEKFPTGTKTLIHPINVQAHRGMDVVYQENTLEGIIAAAYAGANTIEVDPRLTKDKKIVLSHDESLSRINYIPIAGGNVSDYTLSQLQSMYVRLNETAKPARFCSLEDVFKSFKRLGIKNKLSLDGKETNTEYIDILYDLIEEYDAWDNICNIGVADSTQIPLYAAKFEGKVMFDVVSSTAVGIKATRSDSSDNPIPEDDGWIHVDCDKTVSNWMRYLAMQGNSKGITMGSVDPFFTTFATKGYDQYEQYWYYGQPKIQRMCKDRGIKAAPYQFDEVHLLEEAFYQDYKNLSTGYIGYLANCVNLYSVKDSSVTLGKDFNIMGTATLLSGDTNKNEAEGFLLIEGDNDVISYNDGVFKANKEGSVKVMLYTSYSKYTPDLSTLGISYRVYSDIITLNVGKDAVFSGDAVGVESSQSPKEKESSEGEKEEGSSCSSSILSNDIDIVFWGLLVVAIDVVFAVIRTKYHA